MGEAVEVLSEPGAARSDNTCDRTLALLGGPGPPWWRVRQAYALGGSGPQRSLGCHFGLA